MVLVETFTATSIVPALIWVNSSIASMTICLLLRMPAAICSGTYAPCSCRFNIISRNSGLSCPISPIKVYKEFLSPTSAPIAAASRIPSASSFGISSPASRNVPASLIICSSSGCMLSHNSDNASLAGLLRFKSMSLYMALSLNKRDVLPVASIYCKAYCVVCSIALSTSALLISSAYCVAIVCV